MRIKEIEEMNPVDTATWLCHHLVCIECWRSNKLKCIDAINSDPIGVMTEMGFHVVEESRTELLSKLTGMEPDKEYRNASGRYRINSDNGHFETMMYTGEWKDSKGIMLTNLINERETLNPVPKYTAHDVEVAKAIKVLWPGIVAVKKNGSFMDGIFSPKSRGINLAPIWPFYAWFDYWVDLDEIINSQTK